MSLYKFILFSMWIGCAPLHAEEDQETNIKTSENAQLEIIHLTSGQIADSKIEVRNAGPASLKQILSVPAKITVNELNQAVVVAKAPGIVTMVNKSIGDVVEANETLAVLESKEMAEAKGVYITALKRNTLAAHTLSTEMALKEKKISSEQDYLHALLAAEEAHINLEVAAQQLHLLGMHASDIKRLSMDNLNGLCCYPITAPIKGVIIEKNISLGSQIGSDQEVFKIADLDTVWVELGIYSNNIAQIKPGHKIFLSPLKADHPTAQAEITHMSPIIDEHTRTATAIALLPNASKNWYPGTYVRVEIVADEIQVPIAVLKEAIQEIDGSYYVFVRHPEGFEKREVQTGRSDANYMEIISGLEYNAPYAAVNTFLLKAEDGKKDAEL